MAEERCSRCYSIDIAVKRGHLRCVQESGWVIRNCTIVGLKEWAALEGHLEILKYLHQQNEKWHPNIAICAAGMGHIDCLEYVHENGCPITADVANRAAEWGHVECVKYVYENCGDWVSWTSTNLAAIKGSSKTLLEMRAYLESTEDSWRDGTCDIMLKPAKR